MHIKHGAYHVNYILNIRCSMYFWESAHRPTNDKALVNKSSAGMVEFVDVMST